jgi:hypothetical protein
MYKYDKDDIKDDKTDGVCTLAEIKIVQKFLIQNPEDGRYLSSHTCRDEDNIKMKAREK